MKDVMPEVSVIIPSYNYARYLEERIESVLAQTYRDFEVIILDDCSTDNSREVIERYRGHEKVAQIIYNQKNSGSVFRQWCKGISLARGEYIWMAESDDVAEPSFLEKLMGAIGDDKSVAFAVCDTTIIDENSVPFATWGITDSYKIRRHDGHRFIRRHMMYENAVHNASSVVFRRDIALGIPDDYAKMRSAGDFLFWIELANCGKVIEVPERLNRYRKHRCSVTRTTENTALPYSELHVIYRRLIDMGYTSLLSRYNIAGMRLWRMRLMHASEHHEMADTLGKWRSAVRFPTLAECLYMLYAFTIRLPAKKFFNKKKDIRNLPSESQ